MDPERVEAYRSMGWRLVGQLGPFWVWRCDDPNAPELDTDPVVQGEGYRYLKRRMIFRTVGGGLIWLAMTAYFILAVALSAASLENILRNASWLGFVAAPLVAAALLTILGVQLWLDARNTWRLWKTLTAGVPLERPIPPSAAAGTAGVGRCTGHICAESGGQHSESGRQSLWLGPCGADGL